MVPVLLALVLQPSRSAAEWQQCADKIAPYMADFKIGPNEGNGAARFTRILAKIGLHAKYDAMTRKQIPGLYVMPSSGVILVVGDKAYLVWLRRIYSNRQSGRYTSATVLFEPSQGCMRASVLSTSEGDRDWETFPLIMPKYACRSGSVLAVSGLFGWYSNAPQVAVQTFRCSAGVWKPGTEKIGKYQCEEPPLLSLGRNGTIEIARFQSRTYPNFMNSSHAAADLSFVEKWRIVRGEVRCVYRRFRMTPYNQLDQLYSALCHSKIDLIRRLSANEKVARAIFALHDRTKTGNPGVFYPGGRCSIDGTIIGINNLRVWFHFVRKDGKWVVAKLTPMGDQ